MALSLAKRTTQPVSRGQGRKTNAERMTISTSAAIALHQRLEFVFPFAHLAAVSFHGALTALFHHVMTGAARVGGWARVYIEETILQVFLAVDNLKRETKNMVSLRCKRAHDFFKSTRDVPWYTECQFCHGAFDLASGE